MATNSDARRRIAPEGVASSCYFRTSTISPQRKALLQITERCNLHCAHCFVSAGRDGLDIPIDTICKRVLPQLAAARVSRLTLTGGEPFAHPDVLTVIEEARVREMRVTVCSNGTLIGVDTLDALEELGGVAVNVSLDGFSAASHGKFRGDPGSFEETVTTIQRLGKRGLLKGILVTPNALADPEEYELICDLAIECSAEYVLMNPLAAMGRGVRSQGRLAAGEGFLRDVGARTRTFAQRGLDIVHIRFPNDEKPLSGCEAGTIIYVFATGDVTVCPYLVFAARTPQSQYSASEFIVGNVFEHDDIPRRLDTYRLHDRGALSQDPLCGSCPMAGSCGRGCPAAVVAAGGRLGDRDAEQCPRSETGP
jgi:radical SAM protein with 4Fe4S-binding SPASM domain